MEVLQYVVHVNKNFALFAKILRRVFPCPLVGGAKLLEPMKDQLDRRGGVAWSHPAFANKHVYARNDKELLCADLSAKP